MIVHSTVLDVSLKAAHRFGLPDDRIVLLDNASQVVSKSAQSAAASSTHKTVPDLIAKGLDQARSFTERILRPGEGKTKVALLSWSSGTTGTPKVCN
jgi:long-subunit acyl-CoA synthetase (AMP-forming)